MDLGQFSISLAVKDAETSMEFYKNWALKRLMSAI